MLIVIYDPTSYPILLFLANDILAFVAPLCIRRREIDVRTAYRLRTAEQLATRPKCGQFSRSHTVPRLRRVLSLRFQAGAIAVFIHWRVAAERRAVGIKP